MLLIISAGCGNVRSRYVGTWIGEAEIEAPAGADPAVVTTARRVKLEIKTDGTFVLTQMGLPREGDVLFGTDRITLRVQTYVDRPISMTSREGEHPDMTVRAEGESTLILDDPSERVGRLIRLRRQVK